MKVLYVYLSFVKKCSGIPDMLKLIFIYRLAFLRQMEAKLLDKTEATLPTSYYGTWKIHAYKTLDKLHHVAIVKGEVKDKENVLVRVHSECLTGDVLHSQRCDCGEQLERAMKTIDKEGRGIILYLRHEGRGIGLFNKIKAYQLQEQGMDTVEANEALGFKADSRDYSVGVAMLMDLKVKSIRLMTNNPRKINGLEKSGIKVVDRVPIVMEPQKNNKYYLDTKKVKLGHMIDKDPDI